MAQVLSQDEIDALLSNVEVEEESAAPVAAAVQSRHVESGRKAVLYDFKHPNRVSKDQLRSLESLHDNFANQFGSALSGFTRSVVDVDLISVDQITYSEFVMSLATPSCTYIFALSPIEGAGILDFNPSVAFSFVDRMFGGKGKALTTERELTGIERSIMSKIIARAFQGLGKSWEHVDKLEFKQSAFESNPQFIQIVPPGETVIVVSLQIKMLSSSGLITLCYPYLTLEPIMEKLSAQHWIEAKKRSDEGNRFESNTKSISEVKTKITAFLGNTTLTLKDFIGLKPGDVVRLDESESDDSVIFIGDSKKFVGRPGIMGRNKAVKITNII